MAYDDISTMEGLSAIRKRSGMYVGSTGSTDGEMPEALIQIFQEALSNSIDEALSGYGDTIDITVGEDNSMTISDHGRGIPMGKDFDAVIRSFTVLHSSGKFNSEAYSKSGGLNGVGLKAVTALSTHVEAHVVRSDVAYDITFQLEKVVSSSHRKPKRGEKTGTTITFYPDLEVFDVIDWDIKELKRKINAQAYLTPTVTYTLTDHRITDGEKTFIYHHPDGISDMVRDIGEGSPMVGTKDALQFDDVAVFDGKKMLGLQKGNNITPNDDNICVDVSLALAYTDTVGENIVAYTNGIPNKEYGFHVEGTKKGVYDALSDFASTKNLLKRNEKFSIADSRDGIILVVSVGVPESIIDFKGQTKGELTVPQAKIACSTVMEKYFSEWLYSNEKSATKIIDKAKDSAAARDAAREARRISQESRKRSSKKEKLEMSSKLVPGRGDPEYRELFIVEGDSAAGSVISARVPEVIKGKKVVTQGVLPIRGKMPNVTGLSMSKILGNEEVRTIINVLGAGFGEDFDINNLQYHKIIICSDADDDGFHIRTLLINLLWTLFPELVKQGCVFIANPPLFRFKRYKNGKAETAFALTNDEYEKMKGKYSGWDVTRLKGLGEMDARDLSETTVSRGKRILTQVTVGDAMELSRMLNLWMGKGNAEKRREVIFDNSYIEDVSQEDAQLMST